MLTQKNENPFEYKEGCTGPDVLLTKYEPICDDLSFEVIEDIAMLPVVLPPGPSNSICPCPTFKPSVSSSGATIWFETNDDCCAPILTPHIEIPQIDDTCQTLDLKVKPEFKYTVMPAKLDAKFTKVNPTDNCDLDHKLDIKLSLPCTKLAVDQDRSTVIYNAKGSVKMSEGDGNPNDHCKYGDNGKGVVMEVAVPCIDLSELGFDVRTNDEGGYCGSIGPGLGKFLLESKSYPNPKGTKSFTMSMSTAFSSDNHCKPYVQGSLRVKPPEQLSYILENGSQGCMLMHTGLGMRWQYLAENFESKEPDHVLFSTKEGPKFRKLTNVSNKWQLQSDGHKLHLIKYDSKGATELGRSTVCWDLGDQAGDII